jgi:hypothetical protein
MQFKNILAAVPLVTLGAARIVGIAVPDTVAPGQGFNAIIEVVSKSSRL